MGRIVAVFGDKEQVVQTEKNLVDYDLVDYRTVCLGKDYEQEVRQEIFNRHGEGKSVLGWGIIGAILGLVLVYYLDISQMAVIMGRFNASGWPALFFFGAALGFILASLLAALYWLCKPLPGALEGRWMLVLYCQGLGTNKTALRIINSHQGVLI